MPPTKDSLEWFKLQLEFLLEDARLEDAGLSTTLYFDTEDFAYSVLGMYAYLDREQISAPAPRLKWNEFERDSVLIHCLASRAWLGRIELLPPHQAEFLGLMKEEFRLSGLTETPKHLGVRFLAGGFGRIDKELLLPTEGLSLDDLTRSEYFARVEAKAGLAKESFKLVQSSKGSWRTRLVEWANRRWIREIGGFDPRPYFESEVYAQLREALDHLRELSSFNNLNDALAMAMLAEQVAAFNNGETKELPLFFDHRGILRWARERADVERFFVYNWRDEKGEIHKFSVFRDESYLFLRATFGHKGQDQHDHAELMRLRSQIAEVAETRQKLSGESVRSIEQPGQEIETLVEYLREFKFFEATWSKSFRVEFSQVFNMLNAAEELEDGLSAAINELGSDRMQDHFRVAQEAVIASLAENVQRYEKVRDLFGKINTTIRRIQRSKERTNAKDFSMVLVLGLFRFGFEGGVSARIASALEHLSGPGNSARRGVETEIISILFQAEAGDVLNTENLGYLLGVLWAAELDEEIVVIAAQQKVVVDSFRGIWPRELSIVLAAAHLRQKFESRRFARTDAAQRRASLKSARVLLEELEQEFAEEVDSQRKAEFAIGLGYLHFHLALAEAQAPDPEIESGQRYAVIEGEVSEAVKRAKYAVNKGPASGVLSLYAMNLVLYYSAEAIRRGWIAFSILAEDMAEFSQRLIDREFDDSWHYRYDDSLARYWECKAVAEKDVELLKAAWERLKKARSACWDDPLTVEYYAEFMARNATALR